MFGRLLVMGCCLCLLLDGCTAASGLFSLRETGPDAYDVATEPPLVMPPKFNHLPKPRPGAPPTQRIDFAKLAEALLDPRVVLENRQSHMTQGQKALLQETGSLPHGLQAKLDRNRGPPVIVNAEGEWRRLQEDAALGRPITDGKTPVIKPPGHLFGIFGLL